MNSNKEIKQIDSRKNVLMKDNSLIKSKYEITLLENKVHNYLLYKFQKDGSNLVCTISLSEMKEIVTHKGYHTVSGISKILDRLYREEIALEELKSNKVNKIWHKYHFIDGYSYDDEQQEFHIRATSIIYDLLKKRFENGGYTPINLNIFLGLKNYYAQRFYELLRLWSATKNVITYDIEEIKDYLMLSDKYPEFGNFNRRVIKPAIEELNRTGYFSISVKANKESKKVISLTFTVEDNDTRKYFLKEIVSLGEEEFKVVDVISNEKEAKTSSEFYIPQKSKFTKKVTQLIEENFSNYNFKDKTYEDVFVFALESTLKNLNTDKVKKVQFNYFKKTLTDRIEKLTQSSEKTFVPNKSFKPKKNRFHNCNNTFEKYTPEELEQMLMEKQREKFGVGNIQNFIKEA